LKRSFVGNKTAVKTFKKRDGTRSSSGCGRKNVLKSIKREFSLKRLLLFWRRLGIIDEEKFTAEPARVATKGGRTFRM